MAGPEGEVPEDRSNGHKGANGTEARRRRLQLIAESIGVALRIALIAIVALLLLIAALMVVEAVRSGQVVVEAFEVPKSVAETGATGEVVANGLVDELARLQAATRTDAQRRLTSNAWSADIKVAVPRNGFSLGEIKRMLAARLGNDIHVRGNVTRENGSLRMTVRGDGIPARSFTGRSNQLSTLTTRAAEHVYGLAEPALFLLHLNQSGRGEEAVRFAAKAFQAADSNRERSTIAARWAAALTTLGRYDEAKERAEIAVSLDPSNWRAYTTLVGAFRNEEHALTASRWLRRRVAANPLRRRPRETAYVNEYLLTQDWTALVAMYVRDARGAVQQGTSAFSLGPSMAEAEAFRHDHQAARRHLVTADPADHIVKPTGDFVAGLRELELGRADRAVAPLERFNRAMMADRELRHFFRGYQCYLAVAYARLGRQRDALRVIATEPDSSRCRAYRGDVLALGGDWNDAARAYRTAIRRAPSLPIPYERAGAALLARDETVRAARLFRASIQRGPNWADPRFGLGEALMRLGRFADAEREYRSAARFAPRWGALHMAWGEALLRLDRRDEARAKFEAAAEMDLSAANRTRLRRLAAAR